MRQPGNHEPAWKAVALLPLTAVLLVAHSACSEQQLEPPRDLAVRAGVVELRKGDVPLTITLTGQTLAEESAAIRPLVDGMITEILYVPGSEVEKGEPLFQIEAESYSADLESARADLESAKAAVPSAQQKYDRYEQLAGVGVSQAAVDVARTELRQAEAAVKAAEAALKSMQIKFGRTTIRSPIAGIVATPDVSIGDLVTAGQSQALTTVTRLDPISVDLAETSTRFLEVRQKLSEGTLNPGDSIKAVLLLESGEEYQRTGVVETIGSLVSTSTGTLTIRVQFENPDHLILPGVFLRVEQTLGATHGFLVPQLAAEPQVDGTIGVWILDEQDAAQRVYLKPQGSTATSWIVEDGLDEGSRLVVDNLDSMRNGASVQPVEVRIDDRGVVVDLRPSSPGAPPDATPDVPSDREEI